ncbi:glycoside hydrolase family 39 protein [Trichoderma atroviride IMI 206040]|uniref:Glycoside hydrolase family 39 protein n=1 Tax=Hypocrea atroviridis (strain ATCC 20476 / IMI 206040) TaxID=452589 RepID=G9P0X1_HYPAI|nr:glycoside hydrolase family 39 protein [Trichoderma atroviride IMI 206040]EHK43608.1 glycoside hydrolase family 39 protein [Trichoderma atroviride IMI 206040]
MLRLLVSLLPLLIATSGTAVEQARQSSQGTATIDIGQTHGSATFLASGFIYGWPDNGTSASTQIPENLVKGFNFNANRAGGAQLPVGGWATGGLSGYTERFQSALSNYRTTRKYGGEFILLPHDLWGADGSEGSASLFPGDNGNWTEMEAFWSQLMTDLRKNDMLDSLIIDLWNEPDGTGFWPRTWEQAGLPGTLISGPALSGAPGLQNDNWLTWLPSIVGNDTVPDHYSWHQIGSGNRCPDLTVPDFNTLLARFGAPARPIDNNEYALQSEQNPANAAWYMSQFERHDIRALRANWASGSDLHNWMANLVYSNNGTYYPNGEWQVYHYYAGMSGERLVTTASSDTQFDAFATRQGNDIKILAGTRTIQAPYDISVSNLSQIGLGSSGSVNVHVYRFDWNGTEGEVDGPVDLGTVQYSYASDTLTITLDPPTNSTAYAYEFSGA